MRKILFRGKRKDNEEWVEGGLIVFEKKVWIARETANFFGIEYIDVIPETVGQYIGLKDRNGKRIFEGDIVKNNYGGIGKIVWNPYYCAFMWTPLYIRGGTHELFRFEELEVIGNIHDDSKLLEEVR